jgi:hypothetical protein
MTGRPSLFRQEALEFHAGQPRQGGILRIDPAWPRWLYRITLALLLAGVAVAATAHTSETTSGPALINVRERTFVALVPDAAFPDLQQGQLVSLQADGPKGRPLAARVVSAKVADQASVSRAGFAPSSQPGTLVTGVLARAADVASLPSSPQHKGRAVIVLRSQSILGLFFGQLRGVLGSGGP